MASRIARRVVGEFLDKAFRGKQATWKQIPKIGEPVKNRPWMPPGWPYAGWFNFNPSHGTGMYPVDTPKPDVELKRRAVTPQFSIAKRNVDVVQGVDQLPLDFLRTYMYDGRGPLYAENRPQPTAAEIEEAFIERLNTGSLVWDQHEKRDILSRRRFRAQHAGKDFNEEEESKKLDEPLENNDASRQFLKEYAQDLEGFGWKNPYELTDVQVMEEHAVLRDLHITVPNKPWHSPQHEWTQRQDLLVDNWQAAGIPCFAGDAFRSERNPQPAWTKTVSYVGKHIDEENIWGPPGSARLDVDDDMLPPGTDPKAPRPVPPGLEQK